MKHWIMKRTLTLATLSLLLITLAGTALAGDKQGKKCNGDSQTCLNKLASKIQSKAWLGIHFEKTDSGFQKITRVVADSPAQEAGFKVGDVIVAMNGVLLSDENKKALKKAQVSLSPGKTATYVVKRAGGKQKIAVTLGHVPSLVMAEWIGSHMVNHHVETVVASVN